MIILILWKKKSKTAIAEGGAVRIINYPACDNKTYVLSEEDKEFKHERVA